MQWIVQIIDIGPGKPADMGNKEMFYVVHIAAIAAMTVSLTSSIVVIIHVLDIPVPKVINKLSDNHLRPYNKPRSGRMTSFGNRIPFYIAIAELLWNFSHLIDHWLLLFTALFPSHSVGVILGMNTWFFFAYQQSLHVVLSVLTYFNVCHGARYNFGKRDWKIHLTIGIPCILSIVPLYLTDSFGFCPYWSMGNANTTGGIILTFAGSIFSLFNALAALFGYSLIQHQLDRPLKLLNPGERATASILLRGVVSTEHDAVKDKTMARTTFVTPSTIPPLSTIQPVSIIPAIDKEAGESLENCRKGREIDRGVIAGKCLASLMKTAGWLYVPLSMSLFVISVCMMNGFSEPVSNLIAVVFANAFGAINGYTYFQNENLKRIHRASF